MFPVRFRLRTLLILVSVLGICFAIQGHRVRQRSIAIKTIKGLGGSIRLAATANGFAGLPLLDNSTAEEVHFLGLSVDDSDLEAIGTALRNLHGLKKVVFVETLVSRAGRDSLRREIPAIEVVTMHPVEAPAFDRIRR